MNTKTLWIFGLVENLMFSTRIESLAENAGYRVYWLEVDASPETILDEIERFSPHLMVIDLGIDDISWESWIQQVKGHASGSRLPIIAFHSHKDIERFKAAKRGGADEILARSRFFSTFNQLINKYR